MGAGICKWLPWAGLTLTLGCSVSDPSAQMLIVRMQGVPLSGAGLPGGDEEPLSQTYTLTKGMIIVSENGVNVARELVPYSGFSLPMTLSISATPLKIFEGKLSSALVGKQVTWIVLYFNQKVTGMSFGGISHLDLTGKPDCIPPSGVTAVLGASPADQCLITFEGPLTVPKASNTKLLLGVKWLATVDSALNTMSPPAFSFVLDQ